MITIVFSTDTYLYTSDIYIYMLFYPSNLIVISIEFKILSYLIYAISSNLALSVFLSV